MYRNKGGSTVYRRQRGSEVQQTKTSEGIPLLCADDFANQLNHTTSVFEHNPTASYKSSEEFMCLHLLVSTCFAGERGDGGEAGGPVPSHCFQHSDAGLQENPGESLSNGLEPQHIKHFVASGGVLCTDTLTHTRIATHTEPFLVYRQQMHNICSSAMFASHSAFKHWRQHIGAILRSRHQALATEATLPFQLASPCWDF